MFGRALAAAVLCLLALPSFLWAQTFNLEAPINGGKESGLGDVHGWKCTGTNLTYTINNSAHIALAYGILRNDTIGQCGDANNGFISQQNWNFLPPGQYTLRVFDNGVQFAQATFSVANLGTEFLSGASGTYQLNFAGQTVTIQWQENKQNFTITSATGGGGGGTNDLSSLLGIWEFIYTIVSTYHDHFSLPAVTTQNGIPVILGEDLDFGGAVFVAKTQDLVPGSSVPFAFALLDPDLLICDFFVFNKTGNNTVSGQYYLAIQNSSGVCTSLISGDPSAMTGVRTNSIAQQGQSFSTFVDDDQKLSEVGVSSTLPSSDSEEASVDLSELERIMHLMQQ